MRHRFRRLLLAALALMLTVSSAQAAVDAKVTRDNLPVFSAPSFTKACFEGTLSKGTTVSVLAINGDWARITLNGRVGYTGVDYLTPASSSSNSAATTRIKGYATRTVTVYKSASTSSTKLWTLPTGTEVYVVGVSGKFCKVQNAAGSLTGYIYGGYLSRTKPQTEENTLAKNKAQVIKVDWFEVGRYAFERGSYYYLYDIRNGQMIRVKYTTGSYHMDLEPATASDTAKLKKACGGSWTYRRLPMILIAEGKFIAASLYGEPHGETDTISNNDMDGVVCLHLTNSRTHGSENVDADHQAAINAAYAWAHG